MYPNLFWFEINRREYKMGGHQSNGTNFKWVDKYELIDTDNNDKLLKLMSRVGESEYLGKEYQCQGEGRIRQMERMIDKKILDPCPSLMKLMKVGIKTESLNCSQHKIFCLIFRKPSKTIKEESIFLKIRENNFSDEEILFMLDSCVRALNYLNEMGESHSKVSSSTIYINDDRSIVLGDPWILNQDNDYNQNMHGIIYPSPEKILFRNGFTKEPDSFLSDLFSLGVVLLEIYFFQHMDIIYEKGYKRMFESKLIQKLNCVQSKELKRKLKIITSHQPNKRRQIVKEVQNVDNKTEKFINLEKESFKKQYLQSLLITSEVKTVKINRRDCEPREKTMVNRADSSRNPSDFSSDTITENKEVRHLTFTPEPAQIYIRPTKTMAPIASIPPIVRYSRPSHYSSQPESRSSFTFQKKNEVFEENDGNSISSISKNSSEDSRDNIQLELFESSRRNEKRSQVMMRSSDIVESPMNSFGQERVNTDRFGVAPNYGAKPESKNSTLVFNTSKVYETSL